MASNNQLKSSIEAVFTTLKNKFDALLLRTNDHFTDRTNPHVVTKAQVGLGELPNGITSLRTQNTVSQLLTAKGMFDHAGSDDHDGRYYTKALIDQSQALKVDIASVVNDLISTSTDVPLSAAQGKVLKDAVDAINTLVASDDTTLDELQELVDFIKVNKATLDNLSIPSISGLGDALDSKVNKLTGKGLSENDFTDTLLGKLNAIASGAEVNVPANLTTSRTMTSYIITNSHGTGVSLVLVDTGYAGLMSPSMLLKLNGIETGAEVNTPTTDSRISTSQTEVLQARAMTAHTASDDHDGRYYTQTEVDASLGTKVNTVLGYGLSAEDYTALEKAKLSGIAANAQVNVNTNLSLGGSGNARTLNSSTGSNVAFPVSSGSSAGLMSTSQFDKLVGIEAGAQVNVATNLDRTLSINSITITNNTGTNAVLPGATTNTAGMLSAADKTKLNGVAIGAQVNVATNLDIAGAGDSRVLTSTTGSNVALTVASTVDAGLMGINDRTKLDGINSGAQVNVGTDLSVSTTANVVSLLSSTGNNVNLTSATVSLAGVMSAPDKAKLNAVDVNAEVNTPTTASRASVATDVVLQAKAMSDHVASGDHDARYYPRTEADQATLASETRAADYTDLRVDLGVDDIVKYSPALLFGIDEVQYQQGLEESFAEVFNTWLRISHNTSGNYPASVNETNAWTYDSANDTITCTINSATLVGFISPKKFETFNFEVRVNSPGNDDDDIGVCAAFKSLNGREYTITANRNTGGIGPDRFNVVYNYKQTDAIVLGSSSVGLTSGVGWSSSADGCRIRVERVGDVLVFKTTDLNGASFVASSEITVDLSTIPELSKFKGPAQYGYVAYSQAQSTWSTLARPIDIDQIVDVENRVRYDYTGESWTSAPIPSTEDLVDKQRFYFNDVTGRLYLMTDTGLKQIPLGSTKTFEVETLNVLKDVTFADNTRAVRSDDVTHIVRVTESNYPANPDPETLYIVVAG